MSGHGVGVGVVAEGLVGTFSADREFGTHIGVTRGRLFIELGVMGILESSFLLMKNCCIQTHNKDKQLYVKGLHFFLTP